MKVCVVSSCGGHLTEIRCLREAYARFEHFYILNSKIALPQDMRGRTYFISHAERDWRVLLNLWEAAVIVARERPDVIVSAGAGPAVPVALVGKLLFGCRVLFVETIARVSNPSLTGRIMYRLADEFWYQHEPLRKFFPKGRYGGTVV
jgi:UDP-N-acetylglucosamine:LPS N-acetylglucosamine transferase